MSVGGPSASSPSQGLADEAVNVRRYLQALRQGAWLVGAIMLIITGGALAASLLVKKTYQSTASVVYSPAVTILQPSDATSVERQLATYEALVTTPPVLSSAAKRLAESAVTLKSAISASVDPSANIIRITASAPRRSLAAARANAVARAFLAQAEALQTASFNTARTQLEAQAEALKGAAGSASQIAAIQSRINALQVDFAGTTSQLQISEYAGPPKGAASPRPVLNTIIALFASLLLGVLVALGRDQLRPRFGGPRELSRTLDLPVLGSIPQRPRLGTARRRRVIAELERETYDALQASVRLLGPAQEGPQLIVVTSAVHGEGKTSVTANLGKALARVGKKTLVVSGDLRVPTLHDVLGAQLSPGLTDLLSAVQRQGKRPDVELGRVVKGIHWHPGLEILPAGQPHAEPSSLLSSGALQLLFDALREGYPHPEAPYDYILIDSPPLLGVGDTSFLSRQVKDVLVVARLARATAENIEDLKERIAQLKLNPLGLVVLGTKVEMSPYYISERQLDTSRS
jgi:tyrosine-protein kinase